MEILQHRLQPLKPEMNDGTVEHQPLKRNTIEDADSPHYQQTMRPENKMTQKEGEELGTPCLGFVSVNDDTEDIYYDTNENLPTIETTDKTGKTQIRDEEKSPESISRSRTDRVKQYNENEDEQRITNLSDGTVESLKLIEPPTGEQDKEQCSMLFNLLTEEGLKLTQEVVTAVFTRETGQSAKMLLENLTDKDEKILKEVMPEQSRRILDSEEERETSLHVSYGLHRIFLDEKHKPKSGWGNAVRETDIDVGDDVERLYRIYSTIESDIQNPEDVSIESYNRAHAAASWGVCSLFTYKRKTSGLEGRPVWS